MRQQYGLIEIMSLFPPQAELKLLAEGVTAGVAALREDIPSLALLREAYGEEAATEWLNNLLYDLVDYCEHAQGVDNERLEEFSRLCLANYYYLNMCELLLFFAKVKTGAMGKIYGTLGAMRLMEMLNQYMQLRNIDIDKVERQRATEARMQPNNDITWQEWQELKKKK